MKSADTLPNLLRLRAEREPDRLHMTEVAGRSVTFGQEWDEVCRWATVLAEHGVGAGDRVVVMQPPSIVAHELWVAPALLHAIEVPINTQYVGDVLAHQVNNSGARVIVCAEKFVQAFLDMRDALESVECVIVSDADCVDSAEVRRSGAGFNVVAGRPRYEAALPLSDPVTAEPWDIATILYTSGTTGPAKGVLVPWGQAHATVCGSAPERALRTPDTVQYSPYPTFHVSGKVPFYGTVLGGGQLVVRERFDTASFWDDIRTHGCTSTLLMGATANFMFRQPPRPDDRDNPLRGIVFSPWTADVEGFKERFDVEAYSVFNMTEISAPIVAGWENEPITDPTVCGRARTGYDIRLVDDHDQEVPVNTPGELLVRTDEPWTLMAGYWQMPEKTVEAWRNQWLHTGDLFSIDEEGNLRYLDRKKDSIRRRGENISSLDVETQVVAHPAVLEAAVVGVYDEISEEEVKVSVVLKPGEQLRPPELVEFLQGRIPRFMVPRYVEIHDELPKTPSQKIRKVALRELGVTAQTWDREAPENTSPHTGGARS